ncbi:hypothetical protein D3C83_175040 [compost metagenome]
MHLHGYAFCFYLLIDSEQYLRRAANGKARLDYLTTERAKGLTTRRVIYERGYLL